MLVRKLISRGLLRSSSAAAAIFSNGAQVAGLAFAATGQPRSLGTMVWNRSDGEARVVGFVPLNPSSVPLILTLYQVACKSRPRSKANCGANSIPALRLFDFSGASEVPPSRVLAWPEGVV